MDPFVSACLALLLLAVLVTVMEARWKRAALRRAEATQGAVTDTIFIVCPIIARTPQDAPAMAARLVDALASAKTPRAITIGVVHYESKELASDLLGQDVPSLVRIACDARGIAQPSAVRYRRRTLPSKKARHSDVKQLRRSTVENARHEALTKLYGSEDFVLFVDLETVHLGWHWDTLLLASYDHFRCVAAKTAVSYVPCGDRLCTYGETPERIRSCAPCDVVPWACSQLLFAPSEILQVELPDRLQQDDAVVTSWSWSLRLRAHRWRVGLPLQPVARGPVPSSLFTPVTAKRRQRILAMLGKSTCSVCGEEQQAHTSDTGHLFSSAQEHDVRRLPHMALDLRRTNGFD